MAVIEPYNESPAVRVQATPTEGMDTITIDQHRQGVSLLTDRHRYLGPVKIGAGTQDHQLVDNAFGQPKLFDETLPHEDQDLFDATEFVEKGGIVLSPIVVSNADTEFPDMLDGCIEPLAIRSIVNFSSIDAPFEAHDVRGSFMGGSGDPVHGSAEIVHEVDIFRTDLEGPFFDAQDTFGDVPFPGLSAEVVDLIRPFDELMDRRRTLEIPPNELVVGFFESLGVTVITFEDDAMVSASQLNNRTPDEGLLNFTEISSRGGFVYDAPLIRTQVSGATGDGDNTYAIKTMPNMLYGTDSIAFGGLIQ